MANSATNAPDAIPADVMERAKAEYNSKLWHPLEDRLKAVLLASRSPLAAPVAEGWRDMASAPKGEPTEDAGCRGASEWFLARPSGKYGSAAPFVVVHRRPWPNDDTWADNGETFYRADYFGAWAPLSPAPGTAPSGTAEVEPLEFIYKNWRGEVGKRRVIPGNFWFGSTDWHPEPQWLLKALDLDKNEQRDFAIKDIAHPPAVEVREPDTELVEALAVAAENASPEHDQNYSNDRAYEIGVERALSAAGEAVRNHRKHGGSDQ